MSPLAQTRVRVREAVWEFREHRPWFCNENRYLKSLMSVHEPPAPNAPGNEAILCRQCRRSIPLGARLCSHCNSFQDWRGYLSLSNSVLALLVALVSVSSIALSTGLTALRGSSSKLIVSNPVFKGEEVYLVATNTGQSPGTVASAEFESVFTDDLTEIEFGSPADAFVAPGARQLVLRIGIKLNAMDSNRRALDPRLYSANPPEAPLGKLGVWVRQSDGQATKSEFPLNRSDLFNLLTSHAERCQASREPPTISNGCQGLEDVHQESQRVHDRLEKVIDNARNR